MRWLGLSLVILSHCTENLAKRPSTLFGIVVGETHASREVFFFVSAFVLTWAYQEYRPFPWVRYYWRRLRWIVLPYVVWSGVYFGLSYEHFGGFSLVALPTGSPGHQALDFLGWLGTGIGHLYYLAVLLRVLLVWPLVLWFLRRTRRLHLLWLAAALAGQILLMLDAGQGAAANRNVLHYELYLVAGALAAAHLPAISAWLRRWWWLAGLLALGANVGAEASFVDAVRHGMPVYKAFQPFTVRWTFLDLSAIALAYLVGWLWVRGRRPRLLDATVRAASANSYGVYLCHGVVLDALLTLGWAATLDARGVPWYAIDLGGLVVIWLAAAGLCSVLARTPLAPIVGRPQRPWFGAPALGRFEPPPPRPDRRPRPGGAAARPAGAG